ncbi:MAG: DUF2911 domain-containing protein [Crocinitomix sp.]|nr:DUF2911 domain-containing protein [Crocinitomix sp.]
MKSILFAFLLLGASATVTAQVKSPQPSPAAELEQTIGLTEVKIEYSRPGVKGRTIFGELVPFGKVWRTGANKAVQFSTSTDIKFGGTDIKAGNYALYTVPGKDKWDVILYTETEIWGTPETWNDSLEAARVTVNTSTLNDNVESFTISINNIINGTDADLNISWAKTKVTVKIVAPTIQIAQASIDKTMAGPTAGDYYSAASFYLESSTDTEQAYTWIKKAIELRGGEAPFWMLRKQSLIEAKLGKKKEAIATAKLSMAAAEKAGNADYVKMNVDSIAEWSK